MNIHIFDGKLQNNKSIEREIQDYKIIGLDVKKEKLDNLRDKILKKMNDIKNLNIDPIKNINTIINDIQRYGQPGDPNYDPTNNINAVDLLCICEDLHNENPNSEILEQLIIQLEEMSTGMCPQGRAIRIFQVAISM